MRIHRLQHVPFEGPAAIADWAAARGHQLAFTRPMLTRSCPALSGTSTGCWLQGPMNIYQEKQYSWLKAEKACIDRPGCRQQKTLLGICLGAQLLVDRLGSRVYAGPGEREIGWWPL
ncbi:MAG: hypothetical protein R2864_05420 [Syntrophotaleaceae bacterium]